MDGSDSAQQEVKQQQENGRSQDQHCTVRLCGWSCSTCGYCHGRRASLVSRERRYSSKSYGMLIPSDLSAEIYYRLIRRGWRRSGQELYKPDNWDSCCPALTIRLPVADFTPSKSQRRVLKKMQRALSGSNTGTATEESVSSKNVQRLPRLDEDSIPILKQLADWTRETLQEITQLHEISQPIRYKVTANDDDTISAVSTICAAVSGSSKGKYDRGVLSSLVVARLRNKSAAIDLEAHEASGQIKCKVSRRLLDASASHSNESPMDAQMTPEDLLYDWFRNHLPNTATVPPYSLKITTHSALASSLLPDVHQLYFDYQQQVHSDPPPLAEQEEADWGDATPEYVDQAQTIFLVESPLATGNKTGTFHQHYRINGTLIAVGVLDFLADGLSSVYAFYNATFARALCPLGKFLTLKEIDYCREQNLPFYYLGYYIHSCGKMRYKADYHPSQLLCPVTLQWVGAREAQERLDKESPERHCCQLFEADAPSDMLAFDVATEAESVLLHVGMPNLVTISMLQPSSQAIVRPMVREFVQQVGPDVSRHCIVRME
ncbi:Arginine-tRNA-protein transferase [Fragilaria crotonensis]|nr:Arginine-tRNA-protein transferase [Fragilaria crotonensis]